MKRIAGAAAVAAFAVATGAYAQGGPVNHTAQSGSMEAPQPVMAASMTAPAPGVEASLESAQTTLQADLDQHKISHSKAALKRRKLKAIHDQITKLNQSVANIQNDLPAPDPAAAPPP